MREEINLKKEIILIHNEMGKEIARGIEKITHYFLKKITFCKCNI